MKSTRAPSGNRRSPTRSGTCAEPLGLCGDGLSGQAVRAREPVYTIDAVAVFEKTTLGNGVRVLTAPMPQVGSVSCFVMLAAGSRYETAGSKGIAHFAEHMFFKGTERRPTARTISTEIDAIGGEFNAFTGKELTGYYVVRPETRDVALDVLVDMLRNSRFDPAEIEKEKGVILEEMNVYLDTPQRYVGNVYDRLLLRRPAARLGHPRDARDDRGRDARDVHVLPRHLVPARAHRRRRRRADRRRPRRPPRGAARRTSSRGRPARRPTVELPPDGSPVLLHTKHSEQAHLVLGVRGYPIGHPEPVRAPAPLGRARRRDVVAPLHRGARAARPRLLRARRERGYTDAGTLYTGPAST